jgi:hypothetical protein
MGRGYRFLVISLVGLLWPARGFAGEALLLPANSETRWTLISPAIPESSADNEVAKLRTAPLNFIAGKSKTTFFRSPANARWARMAAEDYHMRLIYFSESVHYPDPDRLPMHVQTVSQAF